MKESHRGIPTNTSRRFERIPLTVINRFKQKTMRLPRIDDKKYVEEVTKLVKRLDRLFARAYEVEEWKEEREYLRLFHLEIQKLVRSNQRLRL